MISDRMGLKGVTMNYPYITVFDFETSGLNSIEDRVIEIAAIKCKDNKVISEFSTLVHFDGQLSPKIVELTGIDPADLKNGMDEDTAFRILNRFLKDSLLVAHNAAFDLAFLHYTLMRIANRSFTNPFIDTLTISRDLLVYPYTLKNACDQYNISFEGAHRAANDVYACWELYQRFTKETDIQQYVNQLGYLKKYGPPKWTPSYATLIPTENRYK